MYTFVQRDEGSSIYTAVAQRLLQTGIWRQARDRDSCRFDLMLGDRNHLPFARLGQHGGRKQLVNYYRGSAVICRKTALVRKVKKSKGNLWRLYLPPSFVLVPRKECQNNNMEGLPPWRAHALQEAKDDRQEFLEKYQQCKDSGQGSVWIAKSTAGAKGDGILISADCAGLMKFIDKQSQAYVLQKYIENPLLLEGCRKFDIRCWVLLDHRYDIFLFTEGVLRTASEPYDPCDLQNITSHLTNHCLQESLSPNYGNYEEGNEMFFTEFEEHLQRRYGVSLHGKVIPQIKTIIVDILTMIKEEINTNELPYESFQLFGFDFMLDTDFTVWLLEVNGAPACASRLLRDLVDCLIETAITPVFVLPPEVDVGPRRNKFEKLSGLLST